MKLIILMIIVLSLNLFSQEINILKKNLNKLTYEEKMNIASAALKISKYNDALEIYKKLLKYKKNNQHIRVELEIARIYFIQKKYKQSKLLFEKLAKLRLPLNVNNNINIYLKKINKKLSKSFYYTTLLFGIGRDSNLNNVSSEDEFFIANVGTFKNTSKINSDNYIQEMLQFNHTYKIKPSFYIKNNFLLYNKNYLTYDEYNLLYMSYKPSIFIIGKNISNNIGFSFNKIQYNKKDYMDNYSIFLKSRYFYSESLSYLFDLEYKNKKYQQVKDINKDSKVLFVNFSIKNNISLHSYTTTSLLYNKERSIKNKLINNNSIGASFELNYEYSSKFIIKPKIIYKNKNFENDDKIYQIKQNDKEYTYSLSLSYLFTPSFILQVNMNNTNIKSNFKSSSYDKSSIRINILKRF